MWETGGGPELEYGNLTETRILLTCVLANLRCGHKVSLWPNSQTSSILPDTVTKVSAVFLVLSILTKSNHVKNQSQGEDYSVGKVQGFSNVPWINQGLACLGRMGWLLSCKSVLRGCRETVGVCWYLPSSAPPCLASQDFRPSLVSGEHCWVTTICTNSLICSLEWEISQRQLKYRPHFQGYTLVTMEEGCSVRAVRGSSLPTKPVCRSLVSPSLHIFLLLPH